MKLIKPINTTIFGAISTALGSLGVVIAELGLCACVLTPFFSLLGIMSLAMGFLSNNRILFIVIGISLLIVSYIFSKRKHTCHVHGKK